MCVFIGDKFDKIFSLSDINKNLDPLTYDDICMIIMIQK